MQPACRSLCLLALTSTVVEGQLPSAFILRDTQPQAHQMSPQHRPALIVNTARRVVLVCSPTHCQAHSKSIRKRLSYLAWNTCVLLRSWMSPGSRIICRASLVQVSSKTCNACFCLSESGGIFASGPELYRASDVTLFGSNFAHTRGEP